MDRKLFLAAIKELNQDKELLAKIDEKKIIVVGRKTDVLIQDFKRVMIKLDDAGLTDEVSEDCIDFFEANLDEFIPKKDSEGLEKVEEDVETPEEGIEEGSTEERPSFVEEKGEEKKKSKEIEKSVVMKFLSDLVDEGKYTRKEIIEKALKQFPDKSKEYFGTYLSDGKNPKYNKFDSLIITDEKGVLSFEE